MTTTIEDLVKKAVARNTAIIELAPCGVCGCSFFYARAGRKHNGCLWCKHIANNQRIEAKINATKMIDENGAEIYEGRACSKCGGYIRLVGQAYGTKQKKGACRECAIQDQQEREFGKEMVRFTRKVSHLTHKFVVSSIERSGTVEVAPRNLMEYLEVRELVYRCRAMNEKEKAEGTGINWEIGHRYPASEVDGLVGKATVDNLYIVEWRQNRRDGNTVPDEWSPNQVISIGTVREITKSHEAAKAWKERKDWDTPTKAEQAKRDAREKAANEAHREMVTKLVSEVSPSLLRFFAEYETPTFEKLHREIAFEWSKFAAKTTHTIEGYIKAGIDGGKDYTQVRDQKLTMEAFCEGQSRLWIIAQTFDQLADAESILMEKKARGEAIDEDALARVKRFAVLWAEDIKTRPRNLVMGFTHPMLDVLGDWKVWGSRVAEDKKQWLCAWKSTSLEGQSTPFDEAPDLDLVNKVLIDKQVFPTSEVEPDFKSWVSWKNTADDWAYEKAAEKAKKAEAARRKAEAQARMEQEKAEAEARFLRQKDAEIAELVEAVRQIAEYRASWVWYASFDEAESIKFVESAERYLAELQERAKTVTREGMTGFLCAAHTFKRELCPQGLHGWINSQYGLRPSGFAWAR